MEDFRKYFSFRHRLHLLVAGEYELLFTSIFYPILNWISLSLRSQIYLLSVVAFLLLLFLELDVCRSKRVLKFPAVRPTYVSSQ